MKKILIALAVVLFTINVGAQDTKSTAKASHKKESCCTKAMSAEEIAKCKENAKPKEKIALLEKWLNAKKKQKAVVPKNKDQTFQKQKTS